MVIAMITVSKMGKGKRGALKFLFLIFGAVVSELIMVGGYFIYDIILYRFAGAVAALPGNLLQGTAGVIASILLVTAFEKSGLIKHIKPKQ